MKVVIGALAAILFTGVAMADTYVQGYYRKDGTYVQGHYRSDPNSTKSDNYGTADSKQSHDTYDRYQRDQDGDGISNQYDVDDDNDGTLDDFE